MGRFRADVISEHSLQHLFATDLERSCMTQHWEKRRCCQESATSYFHGPIKLDISCTCVMFIHTEPQYSAVEKIKSKRPFVYIIPFKRLVQRRLSEHFILSLSSSLMEQDRKDGCCQQQCKLRSELSPNQTNLKFWSTEIQHINNLFISITEINFKIVTVVK